MIERGKYTLTVAPGGATALDVSRATVIYRNGHLALKQATFTIQRGVIASLVGVNDSGKSTLFKSIMGFITLASGEISVMGHPPAKALKRHLVSYVPQSEEVDWNFPVLAEDVVMMERYGHMGTMRIARQADRDAVACSLERVGMGGLRKRQIGELSGGQRKRVFLARAILPRMAN